MANPGIERLVEEYGERAFQFAFRLAGDADAAREIVQEAYYRALRHWGRYDERRPLENWFFVILRHVFIDHQRRAARAPVSLDASLEPDGPALSELVADREDRVLETLERRESAQRVRAALERLAAEHRAVLFLADVEGLRYERIAEVVGCPLGTVRSRINRARLNLKKLLLEESEIRDRPMS